MQCCKAYQVFASRCTHVQAIARGIAGRKQRNAAVKTAKDPLAKFESRAAGDEERRRVRASVRKHRVTKRVAANARKQKKRVPTLLHEERPNNISRRSVSKPTSRHIPVNCCGRRKHNCSCFTSGRGATIASSLKRRLFQPIPSRVLKSRIQTWQDTGDMPGYMRQIGWHATMRYSWLFPIAFMWRHFSNEQFWSALMEIGAVRINQPPKFALVEKVMRSFKAQNISYKGGVFYSANTLTKYRFGSAAKPAEWLDCDASQDYITKEILALKVMWHVVRSFKKDYDSLQRNPTRQCWKACTQGFLDALHEHTKGTFSDYSLKAKSVNNKCKEKRHNRYM